MSLCQYEDYVNGKVTDSTTGFGIQMSPEVTASVQLNKNGEIRFGTKWMKRLNSKICKFLFQRHNTFHVLKVLGRQQRCGEFEVGFHANVAAETPLHIRSIVVTMGNKNIPLHLIESH